jgi:hypothetical protein
VIILDDASLDDVPARTGVGPAGRWTLVIRQQNLGYGGTRGVRPRRRANSTSSCCGDGQYAPELLPEMVAPLNAGV